MGGRGIRVCYSWFTSYDAFVNDMGASYEAGKTLDRIDNSKGYNKENCRWATRQEQGQHTARVKLTVDKVLDIRRRREAGAKIVDLAKEYRVSYTHMKYIIYNKVWKNAERTIIS